MRHIILSLILISAFFYTKADDIVTSIERDSIITVVQPQKLSSRIARAETTLVIEEKNEDDVATPQPAGGYRILAFSDNNPRTARTEAKKREQLIAEQLPQYHTYIIYDSPYWRLKVGDFKTHDAAEQAATEIKHLFPQYSREIRVIKDRINPR